MSREVNYNDFHEEVARFKTLVGLKNYIEELVDDITQIHHINAELTDYHAAMEILWVGFIIFNETLGTQIEVLLKENKDVKRGGCSLSGYYWFIT